MKKFLVLTLGLLIAPILSWAGSCGSFYNVNVSFQASAFAIEPAIFVVKEGDRVCINFETIDNKPKNMRMEQATFWLQASPNKPDQALYYARKQGEYKITCTGCATKATLIVEDPKKFDARQRRQYEKDSLKQRSNHYYRN